jgi:hypothetical protein
MPFQPVDLIKASFESSNLLRHLPRFDAVFYEGCIAENIHRYKAVREEQECTLLSSTVIRKDEDILWSSTKDLFENAARQAAAASRGTYILELLTFDLHHEIKTFSYPELVRIIINTSLTLSPGEQALIKYSSFYALLQKTAEAHWGKIVFKSAIETFKDKPGFLFTLIGRMLDGAGKVHGGPVMVLVNDMSKTPLYDPANTSQQALLAKLTKDHRRGSLGSDTEIYIQDMNGLTELSAGAR